MELYKNIFFNTDNIIEGSTIKLCYTGILAQNGANEIYLHYGFNKDWENTSEVKMVKTDLGFETQICIPACSTLNFCLKDENNNWDNNCCENYIFNVSPKPIVETNIEESHYLEIVEQPTFTKKIIEFFQRLINYVPKIVSGTWKKKKTYHN